MNEKSTICLEDLKTGVIKEGIRYRFGCGNEFMIIAVQELNGFYWLKTQESEALFDSDGNITAVTA